MNSITLLVYLNSNPEMRSANKNIFIINSRFRYLWCPPPLPSAGVHQSVDGDWETTERAANKGGEDTTPLGGIEPPQFEFARQSLVAHSFS